MRILMLCYEFPPLGGGGAKVVHGLSRELVRSGHEVDLVTMGYRGLSREEVVDGIWVHRVPCIRARTFYCTMPEAASYLLFACSTIKQLAARNQYDLSHAHFILPDGVSALRLNRLYGLPYLVTAHGSDVPGFNPHRLKAAHRLLRPFWMAVTRNAERIVCPSNVIRSLVTARDPRAAVSVIPNGFDLAKFESGREKRRRILVVSRMLERKGVQYVLNALNGFPTDHDVHIVGDGPHLPTLRTMADRLGIAVTFRGWLDNHSPEFKDLLETSSVFVFPSEAENFPIVLLEAMAAGMAIITTAQTGCAEVVGDAAILVRPKDAAGIREALARLVCDPGLCRKLGLEARARLEQNFSWSAVGERYIELYRRAVAHGPSRN